MSVAREQGGNLTLLNNGQAIIVGGSGPASLGFFDLASAEIYDPGTGRWRTTGSLTTARDGLTVVTLNSGQVLAIGGGNFSATTDISTLQSVELYDPTTGVWTATGGLNVGRDGPVATVLQNGQVLVTGGEDDITFTGVNTAELYTPVAVAPVAAPAPPAPMGPVIYNVTIPHTGCGSTTPSGIPLLALQNVSITAVPCPGSVFVGWTGGPCDKTTINPCSIPAGVPVTANFTP